MKGTVPRVYQDKLGNMVCRALEEQADIGRDNFVKDRVSQKWGTAQAEFYKQFHPKAYSTAASWIELLIKAKVRKLA
eukprot:9251722-Ditylum_brightwellii.AAC.1